MNTETEIQEPTVRGPEWTPNGLQIAGGRFPLSVEAHLMSMTGRLVPGATTVTTNARYYSLHGLVVAEAAAQDLDVAQTVELLRRCEVVFGAAALLANDAVISSPHGSGPLSTALSEGVLDVGAMAQPGTGYSNSKRGFWGQYVGSEITLGIVDPIDPTRPGPRNDPAALRSGLRGLVDAARCPELAVAELREMSHLSLNGVDTTDGRLLLQLLVNPSPDVDSLRASDATRRATIKLLLAAVEEYPDATFAGSLRDFVAFTDDAFEHRLTSDLPEAEAWRGVLLRWYSVGAWRRLWKWLVDQLEGRVVATDDLATECADFFPDIQLGDFMDSMPSAVEFGVPLRAEDAVRSSEQPVPVKELQVLLLGGIRSGQLEGRARDAFVGRHTILGPEWMQRRSESWSNRPVSEFVFDLVHQLVRRSQRIAIKKSRLNPKTGGLWIPTRVYERDGTLVRTSAEGGGDVGLRVDQLGGILASLGVFAREGRTWHLTQLGQTLS